MLGVRDRAGTSTRREQLRQHAQFECRFPASERSARRWQRMPDLASIGLIDRAFKPRRESFRQEMLQPPMLPRKNIAESLRHGRVACWEAKPSCAVQEIEDGRPRTAIVRGQLDMTEDTRTVFSIPLSAQEQEFAAACRDFVLQKEPELRSSIVVVNDMLSIANRPHVREAFMEFGLARLVRVLRLAIVGKAIAIRRAPKLLFDLARFRTKIVRALRRRAG
jgi:hypothetical protein